MIRCTKPTIPSTAVSKIHEIHHRGQLTILMRQAGITVSGLYGPSKEEAAAMRSCPKADRSLIDDELS